MALGKDQLRYIIEDENYLPDGTNEACLILRQTVRPSCDQVILSGEELEALRILIAAMSLCKDTAPDMWLCDSDCSQANHLLCKGEMQVNNKAKKMCPYYSTEDK